MIITDLVFEISMSSARLKRCFWVAQDDTFASLIYDILKNFLEMR